MPNYKVTIIFQNEGYGWTESYILNLTAAATPESIYTLYAQPLSNLRLACLAQDCLLSFVRISTLGTPFATYTVLDGRSGTYAVDGIFANVALLLRGYPLTPGPAKSIFMRGIPQTIVDGGEYLPNNVWNRVFFALLEFLVPPTQSPWGWYGSTGVAGKTQSIVTGYTVTVPGYTVTVDTQLPIFTQPMGTKLQVRFTGINGKSELNGLQVCRVVSTTSVMTVDAFGVVPWSRGGTATLQTKAFIPFGEIDIHGIDTRKAGRQLFLERGRAATRTKT